MKHLKWSLLLVLLVCLALGLVACNGGTEDEAPPDARPTEVSETAPTEVSSAEQTEAAEPPAAPTDTPLPEPTEVPEPTEAPEPVEEEELDASALATASDLTSYRSTMRMTIKSVRDGQEREQTVVFMSEYTSEPKVQHIVVSSEGFEDAASSGNLELYVVDETMYMQLEDQWLSVPATEGDMATEGIITPEALLDDMCGWKKEARTEVNGVKVEHWTIKKEDMEQCMPPEEMIGLGELTDTGGDLYVAEDDNYVVQMNLYYEGENLDLDLGEADEGVRVQRMEVQYTTTDVNESFTIQVPEEALASSSLPEDIPVPDDAAEVSSMFGMITFTSPSGIQEIAEFYQAEMPDSGWTETSTSEVSGMYMLEYTKETRTASFIITTGDSGETSVMITVQDGNQ